MSHDATLPVSITRNLLVDNLVLEVLEGPDKGLRVEAEDEHMTVGTAPGSFARLTDATVSGFHLELVRTPDGISVTDLGSTNGTRLGKIRLHKACVPSGTTLKLGNTEIRLSDGDGGRVDLLEEERLGEMWGGSGVMRRLMGRICRVAVTDVPVLVSGESGTGKELVARALHEESRRAAKPFVVVDCGALSPNLVASELFGHERGAFTGAERQHIGAFERATGGTLFLDEIGELPPELQPQLLGALERRRFQRVGGRSEVSVDVRIVAATNRDLRSEVNRGTFRMDLYYRLAVVSLVLPPLRDRPEDLPLLVQHFLKSAGVSEPLDVAIPASELERMRDYHWPGNVRELRNWVEATVAMGEAPGLDTPYTGDNAPADGDALLKMPYRAARSHLLEDFERRYCTALLTDCEGNVSQAARKARMDRSYLIKLAQRHGLRGGKVMAEALTGPHRLN